MRVKSIVEPKDPVEGLEWLSPDGHSPKFRRTWDGKSWVEDVSSGGGQIPVTEEEIEEEDETEDEAESEGEEDEGEGDEEESSSESTNQEESNSERSVSSTVQDGNGARSGQSSPKGKKSGPGKGRKGK